MRRRSALARGPAETAEAEEGFTLDCPCRNRAEVMGALSEGLMDLRPDYSDGLRLDAAGYRLHIAPLPAASALRVCVQAEDTEFARSLAFSARDLIAALA